MNTSNQQGVTLLEAILSLVVAGAILTGGINFYNVYKRDSDIRQLTYNVDNLAQAAAQFYYANCFGSTLPDGTFTPAFLHPDSSPVNPFALDVQTTLIDGGWLGVNLPLNPLIDETTAGEGYTVQLTKTERPKKICTEDPNCTDAEAVTVGTIVDYNVTIGVKIRDTQLKEQYKNISGASCLSSKRSSLAGGPAVPGSGSTVVSCSEAASFKSSCLSLAQTMSAGAPLARIAAAMAYLAQGCSGTSAGDYDNYLVFERKPSAVRSEGLQTAWPAMPRVRQFTALYRTYPLSYRLSNSHTPEYQYYLCGS